MREGRGGMTAAGTPAERGGGRNVWPGCGGASGASSAEGAARSLERSHPAAGAAQPPAPAPRPAVRRRTAPSSRTDSAAGPSSGGPATSARYASALCPQLGPVLPASTGPGRDGVGAAPPTRAMMGRPLGTPPRPDRPRGPAEVGVGRAEPRTGGAWVMRGRGRVGKGGALGPLWAVGSPGELLPTRAFWTVLDPPTPHPQLLPSPGAPLGCLADASVPPSGLRGDHGFADAPLPLSKSHGPPAGQL